MKIKIEEKNYGKIEEILKKANGKARERLATITTVKNLVHEAEKHLERFHAAKKDWTGTEAEYCESVNCNSYGHTADATMIRIVRGSSDWFLVHTVRKSTNTGRGSAERWITPSAKAIESAQNYLARDFAGKF